MDTEWDTLKWVNIKFHYLMMVCACVCTRVPKRLHSHLCKWRPEVNVRFFLQCSSLYILRQGLSLSLDLASLARLDDQEVPGIFFISTSPTLLLGSQQALHQLDHLLALQLTWFRVV